MSIGVQRKPDYGFIKHVNIGLYKIIVISNNVNEAPTDEEKYSSLIRQKGES